MLYHWAKTPFLGDQCISLTLFWSRRAYALPLSYNTLNYSHNPNSIKNNKYQSINILDIFGEKLKRHQKNRNLTPSHRSLEAVRYATLRDLGIDRVYDQYYVCIQLQLANTTSKQYISSYIKNFPVVVAFITKRKEWQRLWYPGRSLYLSAS